jgi:hypothetical protein
MKLFAHSQEPQPHNYNRERERERERERCEELYYITMEEKWDIMATFFKIWFPT